MIDRKHFEALKKELKQFGIKREHAIRDSREVINLSKQIIHYIHRNEFKRTNALISRVALQEYVEAMAYHHFVKYKKLISKSKLKVDAESYLLGLADLSGELVRRAGAEIIRKNYKEAERIKKFVNLLYGEFLGLDLRGSDLRKKSDALRWNLKKLEETMLDFTRAIRGR